jgi:putative transposase
LIKGGFSFAVRKNFPGEVWQEGYHAHRVVNEDDLRNQTFYILNSPVKKRVDAYSWVSSSIQYAHRMDGPAAVRRRVPGAEEGAEKVDSGWRTFPQWLKPRRK